MYDKTEQHDSEDLTIRVAATNEWDAIDRLAQRDSAPPPPRDAMLVAEVGGEMRAALSVRNGYAIADPFRSTEAHIALLRARAAQLRSNGSGQASHRVRRSLMRSGWLRALDRSPAR